MKFEESIFWIRNGWHGLTTVSCRTQHPPPPFFSRCWQWRASGVPSTLDLLDLAYNVLLPKISKDSSQPACFSFWDSPKDLQGYLDPRGAAKHGRMPREQWQRLISQLKITKSRTPPATHYFVGKSAGCEIWHLPCRPGNACSPECLVLAWRGDMSADVYSGTVGRRHLDLHSKINGSWITPSIQFLPLDCNSNTSEGI